jgi:hypothetical protein
MPSIRHQALFSSTTPLAANGPWRIILTSDGDPIGPSGAAKILQSTDPTYATVLPIGTEYELWSETFITVTGLTTAQIDSGDSKQRVRLQATRMTGEVDDKFKVGLHFYDGSNVLVGSALSLPVGTAEGLHTGVWADFSWLFNIPVNARKFKIRIAAIKLNSVAAHARLEFYNARAAGVIQQFTAFADTHASIFDVVARDYWGKTDATLDVGSITTLKTNNPGKAYYYEQHPTITRFDWARRWLADLMALPTYNPAGRLSVAQVLETAAAHTILPKHIFGIPRTLEPPNQHKTRTLEYARNYTLQNKDTLAGAVDVETASFVAKEYRNVKRTSADVGVDTTNAKGAIESTSQTFFADFDGALHELLRQLRLLSPLKQLWEITLIDFQLKMKVCDVANITYTRWRFTTPRTGIILHVKEESIENHTTIYWWG